jgi:hypothetical protein
MLDYKCDVGVCVKSSKLVLFPKKFLINLVLGNKLLDVLVHDVVM